LAYNRPNKLVTLLSIANKKEYRKMKEYKKGEGKREEEEEIGEEREGRRRGRRRGRKGRRGI
jgi:hypothetical protein